MHTINVKFHERRLHEDQNTYVREGDYIQYGHSFYEIVTLTEDRPLFGQVDHLFQITAKCVRTRKGLLDFEVLDTRIQDAAIANAEIIGTSAPPASEDASGDSGESSAPYAAAAKIVHGAEDSEGASPGILTEAVTLGASVNDFFSIPEGQVLEADTIMVFLNGILQLLTTVEGSGDFYINESNQIITNYDLEPGESLVVVFLSAITSSFGG